MTKKKLKDLFKFDGKGFSLIEDTDSDGVTDFLDCQPTNPMKQDREHGSEFEFKASESERVIYTVVPGTTSEGNRQWNVHRYVGSNDEFLKARLEKRDALRFAKGMAKRDKPSTLRIRREDGTIQDNIEYG